MRVRKMSRKKLEASFSVIRCTDPGLAVFLVLDASHESSPRREDCLVVARLMNRS